MLSCISAANSVLLRDGYTTESDCDFRRSKQVEAKAHLTSLFTLMQLAVDMNGIEERRIEHWTGLAVSTQKLLTEWMRSDRERIKAFKYRG